MIQIVNDERFVNIWMVDFQFNFFRRKGEHTFFYIGEPALQNLLNVASSKEIYRNHFTFEKKYDNEDDPTACYHILRIDSAISHDFINECFSRISLCKKEIEY